MHFFKLLKISIIMTNIQLVTSIEKYDLLLNI